MMNKVNLNELASVLVDKHGLTRGDATRFLKSIVDVIHEGVDEDRMVKIKGLGTFKVVEVEARESVNVNTGERVTIESHEKITFTPDTAMKELVNKPFSLFETVVLNDGVTFPDMDMKDAADDNREDDAEKPAENVAETESVAETEGADAHAEEAGPSEAVTEETVCEDTDVTESTGDAGDAGQRGIGLMQSVLACLACLVIGFFLGRITVGTTPQEAEAASVADSVAVADATAVEEHVADTVQVAMATDSILAPEATDSIKPVEKADTTAEPIYMKYDRMDARVRLGAYRIMGTQETVKAKEGETLGRISRRMLGPDMECYVEVYNGMKATDQLKAGQEIKIPKLEWKKSKRRK